MSFRRFSENVAFHVHVLYFFYKNLEVTIWILLWSEALLFLRWPELCLQLVETYLLPTDLHLKPIMIQKRGHIVVCSAYLR